ncbi:hypothetical protein L2E82_50239 [Cichorium intybus]|nr:hypothetical protein L2E82_50239 [Cichorium intybus]
MEGRLQNLVISNLPTYAARLVMGELSDSMSLSFGDSPPPRATAIESKSSRKRRKMIVYDDEDEEEVNQVSLPPNSNNKEIDDNDDDDDDEEEVRQDAKPIGNVVRVSGEGESRRNHFNGFEADDLCYELEDTVLVSPEEHDLYTKPSVAIIKDISEASNGRITVTGRRLYRPEIAEKENGGNWESGEERELFYSFEEIEFAAEFVMHKCRVHFVPPNKTIPNVRKYPGFFVKMVYDAKSKKLCAILDAGYGDTRQHELFVLVQKTIDRIPNWL